MASQLIYLDYAAATPLDSFVLAAMQPYLTDNFYNPSAPYQPARKVRNDIEQSRHNIAKIIGSRTSEIIFTAGATESINLAFARQGHIVVSAIEHAAVLETAKHHEHTIVPVDHKGRVDISNIKSAITPSTTVISIGLVNNEIGVLQDLQAISQLVSTERLQREKSENKTPIYLHTDASQAVGITDIHVSRLGVDMMTLNSAKIYGPKQMGILYAASHVNLHPVIIGGGQERGLRSGTENVAGIIGLAKAIEIADGKRKSESERLRKLRLELLNILTDNFEQIEIIGDQKHHAPHILTVALPGLDAERVLFKLEADNILVATGSACAANKDTRSHVLTALGLEPELIDGSLRFSFGRGTTSDQIAVAAKIIVAAINQEYDRGKKIQ